MSGIRFSAQARNLDGLAHAMREMPEVSDRLLKSYIDMELFQVRRILRDATPVGKARGQVHMRDDWHKERTGLTGRVYNSRPYAPFLFTGTRPHAIPGAFGYPAPFGEEPDFHPGTRPNEPLLRATEAAIEDAKHRLADVGLQLVATVGGRRL